MQATKKAYVPSALLPLLSIVLLGLLARGAWANSQPAIHQLIENQTLTLDTAALFPGETIQAGSLLVEDGPSHGAVHILAGDTLDYLPDPDYIGFDDLRVIAAQINGGRELSQTLSIRVLPRALPVAGRFDGGAHASLGAYDSLDRTLLLCDPPTPAGGITCQLHDVVGAATGWLPLTAGDWNGDGIELPSLFDPTTGTLHHLVMASPPPPSGTADLVIAQSNALPATQWNWPTAGNWSGDGLIRPAFYNSDTGVVQILDDGPLGSNLVTWSSSLPAATGDTIFWPVGWRIEATPRIPVTFDALAVVDPLAAELNWIGFVNSKFVSGVEPTAVSIGRKLPIAEIWSLEPSAGWQVYLLSQLGNGVYRLSAWDPNRPGTVPVDFPNDPPGGGAAMRSR